MCTCTPDLNLIASSFSYYLKFLSDDGDEKDNGASGQVLLHDAQEEQEAEDVRGRANQEEEGGDQRRGDRSHRYHIQH